MTSTISVNDLAKQLGVSPGVVYRGIDNGTIRGVRLGRRVLVPANEGKRLLAVATNGSEAPASAPEAPVSAPEPGNATDRLIQAITLQISTMNGLKADLKNVSELLSILVKELTA